MSKAVEVAIEFWCNEIRNHNKNVTDDQMSIFARELRAKLGKPQKICKQHFDGGAIGYDLEDAQIVPNALKSANIEFSSKDRISVTIAPWYGKPEKRTVWMYRNGDRGTNLADVIEEEE